MKTSFIIITFAWIATIFAAYTIGTKTESSSGSSEASSSERAARPTTRYTSRDRQAGSSSITNGDLTRPSGFSSGTGEKIDIAELMKKSDPVSRSQELLDLIADLNSDQFEQVITDFRAMGMTRERMSEYAVLLHAWAKKDPLAALEYAGKNTGTPFARQTILASWAASSPDAAVSWAEQNHEGEGANPWLIGVIRGVVESDPNRATHILTTLPFSRERGDALSAIVPHIAKQGPEAASKWVASIEDERLRSGAASYLGTALARTNPAAAAEWVTSLDSAEAIQRAVGGVAEVWAESDVIAAVAWTDSLSSEQKIRAAREVIDEYAQETPTEALQWMQTMSGQEGYEDVVQRFIWNTARQNPEISLSQVPEIKDERSRNRYYERIVSSWRGRDQAAADAWMDSNNISADLRKRINNPRSRRGRR